MASRVRLVGLLFASTLLALGAAEAGFRVADDGAFPHLNVYEPDAALGTRLKPGASQRVSFHGNPVTDVRINAAGFRGADWPAPAAGEIVVVGDSQAFGLGVAEGESIPAGIAAATGRPTINAGVPTYGPQEYLAVITRLLAERKPATVILVVNVANDFFELARPNAERHRVWDGWAVRAETMPRDVVGFPGRQLLFRDSHLVFALRRALSAPPQGAGRGLPSEGSAEDVLGVESAPAGGSVPELRSLVAGPGAAPESPILVAGSARVAAEAREEAWQSLFWEREHFLPGWSPDDPLALQAVAQHNRPGDIVVEADAESGRSVPVTAELLRKAVSLQRTLVDEARKWLAAHPDHADAGSVREKLAAYDEAEAERLALASRLPGGLEASPLAGFVIAARDRCEAAGAELVVAALPLDVQVSPGEWAKYGAPPQDMTDTRALLTDLVSASHHAGVRAVDLTDALAAAEPGAFLHGDLHLSPKGTAAVSAALARTLAEPAPLARPSGGLPEGRSRLPSPEEFTLDTEITVKGSTRNRCSTRRVREWLYVECVGLPEGYGGWVEGTPPTVAVLEGPLERATARDRESARLLLPLLPGRSARVAFTWSVEEMASPAEGDDPPWAKGRREQLVVGWEGQEPNIGFLPLSEPAEAAPIPPGVARCLDELWTLPRWTNATLGCADAYPDTCTALLDCALGLGTSPPVCPETSAAAGSSGWCYSLCDAHTPCAVGVCTPWQGGHLCM